MVEKYPSLTSLNVAECSFCGWAMLCTWSSGANPVNGVTQVNAADSIPGELRSLAVIR